MITEGLDRTKRPEIRMVDKLAIAPAEKLTLSNGIPVYIFNRGVQDVCSIDFNFRAGKWQQSQKLVSRFTNRMLREGTQSYTSKEISEKFDFLGASIRAQAGADRASIILSSLNKHLSEALPVFAEVVRQPAFPGNELETVVANSLERLKVDKTKHDFLASRKVASVLFGEAHPYGSEAHEEDFEKVNSALLKDFYSDYYTGGNCHIVLAGRVPDEALTLLEKYFGDKEWAKPAQPDAALKPAPSPQLKHRLKMEHSVQSAIRIGKLLFNKAHPDFRKMQVLNTLLGGYFGSRLMSNIREDKGFTYGIHSGVSSMIHEGYFYVSTEVGYEVTDAALHEIYSEINRLRTELIPDDELQLVRNYLSGKILSGLDGPFKLADFFNGLIIYGLDLDYAHQMLETIKTVTAEELRELAIRYLNTEEMHEVVVG